MKKGEHVPLTMSVTVHRRWLVLVSVLGLLAFVREPADASRLRRAHVVLEGYVGQAPAGITPEVQLRLQLGSKSYEFALTRTAVNMGSRTQLLRDIRPYQNTLVLRGSASEVGGLTSASPGQKLVISGYHRTGTRTLHVTSIGPAPPEPTPAAAQP
jgi:hypothetical protein